MQRRVVVLFLASAITGLSFGEVGASTIVNGDFATGDFTGWTVSAIDRLGNQTTPLINVLTVEGNSVADFPTGDFATGPFIQTLEQLFPLTASEPILSFDIRLPSAMPDPTSTRSSPFFDAFAVSVSDGVDFFDLLLVDRFGALPDPFGTAPGVVALGNPAGGLFDFNFTADLSSLAGGQATLVFTVINEDDGFLFNTPYATNVMTSEQALEHVSEPGTLVLFALALLSVAMVSRTWGRGG